MKGDEKQIKEAAKEITSKMTEREGNIFQQATKDAASGKWIPKNALGITDAMTESLYSQAYRLYNTGKYDDAIELFRILTMCDPTESKFAMGLAACFHLLKDFKSAVGTYMLCSMMEPENPVPHFHASDCYLKMNDKVSALIALEMAVTRAGEDPRYKALVDRATMTMDKIKLELNKGKKTKGK